MVTRRVIMRRGRPVLFPVAVVLVVVLAVTWFGRMQRCQAELAAWAQVRSAVIMKLSPFLLVEEQRRDPQIAAMLDAAGVTRTEAGMKMYCDTPVWDWWR